MTKIHTLTALLLILLAGWSSPLSAREKVNINRSWKFYLGDDKEAAQSSYDDATWTDANLPHSFSIPYFLWNKVYHGYGWYRKTLHVPEAWKNSRVEIEFEGAFIMAEVYLNGQAVGTHVGGYTGFTFDLTPYLHTGDNVLAVRVNNLWKGDVAPRAGDHQFSGGIYRDVYLNVTSPVRVKTHGTFFYCPSVSASSATVAARTEIVNSEATQQTIDLLTQVLNPSGQEVARQATAVKVKAGATQTVSQQLPAISNPQLWSPEHPNRYTAVTTLTIGGKEVDRYTTRFGIRSMKWTADRGFFLNGEHYWLQGANVHQDQAGWGDAVTNGAMVRDVKLMKDAGFNCIRGSHYPHDPAFAEACDSLGMILFMETNFWGMGGNSNEGAWGEGAPASAYPTVASLQDSFDKNVLAQLKEEITIHRNSPSIAAWSLCNEPFFTASSTDARMKRLLGMETDSAMLWDPSRCVAIGGCQRKGIDKLGKNQIAFYNGDGASRSEFQNPGVPNLVSEYGSTVADRPGTFAPGWGDVKDGLTNRPAWRSGNVIWCGFDHGTVGGSNLARMGIVDYFRLPKRAYYWYQQAYRDHVASPVEPQWPETGTPAALSLEASQTTIPSCNGTDDALITVKVTDKSGKQLSNNVPVTLTITSGPGEFPTGRSITFMPPSSNEASDIQIRDGEAAIAFRSYYAGTTTITATADGLTPATLTITSLGDADWTEVGSPVCADRPYHRYVEGSETPTEASVFTLATDRPTSCSSEQGSGYGKSNANDGNAATCWKPAADDSERWWTVCLEAQYNVNRIELTFPDEKAYQYVVELSADGTTWTKVIDQSDATMTDRVRTAAGRFGTGIGYVRIRFTSPLAALAEVRVGGSQGESLLAKDLLGGTIIGTKGSWGNNAATTRTAAIDFDNTTFFDGPSGGSPFWVGLDLGKGCRRPVSHLGYVPRYNPNSTNFADRMVGGKVQVADKPDFSDAVTVATITHRPEYNKENTIFCTDTISRGRYVRYLSTDAGNGNVAELRFYDGFVTMPLPDDTVPATLPEYTVKSNTAYRPDNLNTLWYTGPVTAKHVADPWMDYALPIGNGQLGAMVYGGIRQDIVQFNKKTLWTGNSTERGAYQNFGQLYIEDLSSDFTTTTAKPVKDYYRNLDLERAVATSSWTNSDGVTFTRQYLASYPDQCIAVRLTASEPGHISNHFYLYNPHGERAAYSEGGGVFKGKLTTVSYNARMKVVAEGGQTVTNDSGVWVRGADAVTVILAAGTDYDPTASGYVSHTDALADRMTTTVDEAAGRGWDELLERHEADYQPLFSRVSLSLDGAENNKATSLLVMGYKNGCSDKAYREMEQLYFQYGRYLLISSSRGIDMPNNLQGIWNNNNDPAWQCDMHANINVQMNYWPAENTNLSELHDKYLNYLYNMATVQPQWRDYAKSRCGQSEGWVNFTENNLFGHCTTWHNDYCEAGAWSCDHLWQHYRYTLDKDFLRDKAVPVMVSASKFWMERMVKADDGTWECPNEWSPEHGPDKTVTAHAQQIVWNLLNETRQAIDIVGRKAAGVSDSWMDELSDKLAHMDKGLATETYEGNYGATRNGVSTGDPILREWKYYTYAQGNGNESNHRHMSHLMALYPLSIITPTSPFFKAAVNSLKLRGIESQGWSMGWKINLWARALDGDQCAEIFKLAFKHSSDYVINMDASAGGVYYNLLDAHSPFQIDGNFGVCAGMAEMLLQSYSDTLQLLPALPTIWPKGEVKGLKAVGNFTVSEKWDGGKLVMATITSGSGQECRVSYRGIGKVTVTDADGRAVSVKVLSADRIVFPTTVGTTYILSLSTTSGIAMQKLTGVIRRQRSYSLLGQHIAPVTKGVVIHETVYQDGHRQVAKLLVK